jgi:hypothetical protein
VKFPVETVTGSEAPPHENPAFSAIPRSPFASFRSRHPALPELALLQGTQSMADLSVDAPLLTGRSPPLTINGKVAVIAAERCCWAEQQICRPPFHRRRKRVGYSETFCAFHFIMIMRCLDSHSYGGYLMMTAATAATIIKTLNSDLRSDRVPLNGAANGLSTRPAFFAGVRN